MENTNTPLWISKYLNYSSSIGGQLSVSYGFTCLDVNVYMFLFTNKLFNGQSCFNSYKISQELTKLATEYMLENERPIYNPKSVAESLTKLVAAGFITKIDTVAKKLKGKTPNIEYEAKNISEVRDATKQQIDTIRKNKFNTLSSLDDIEENVGFTIKKEGQS